MNVLSEIESAKALESQIKADMIAAGTPVTCKAGCGLCCYGKVKTCKDEVAHIYSQIDISSINVLRLQSQNLDWDNPATIKKCVFLDSNENCSIHDIKPVNCIRHLTSSPRLNCELGSIEKRKLIPFPNQKNVSKIMKDSGDVYLHEELYKLMSE